MNDEEKENFYACPHCGATYDSSDERDNHVFENHMDLVEQTLSEINQLAEEHKETIENWKDEKRKEFLLKIANENPRLLHEIQVSPHADEILDKMIEEDLFKKALRTETLSSFDAMWLKHPKFEEIYKASRDKPAHQPTTGDSTGQTEETLPEPISPEAKKVLDKKTPVTKVRFQDGKLVLEREFEPQRLPRNTIKYAGNKEDLSEEDRKRLELLLVLKALMRKRD